LDGEYHLLLLIQMIFLNWVGVAVMGHSLEEVLEELLMVLAVVLIVV
jgi:hypothetical protein